MILGTNLPKIDLYNKNGNKDKRMKNINRNSEILSEWACNFLTQNLPIKPLKPKRTRRLSLSEAWIAAKKEKMRMKVFGHYGE